MYAHYAQIDWGITEKLTPAEIRVARLLVSDFEPCEIRRVLSVQSTTVYYHLKNIRAKTGSAGQTLPRLRKRLVHMGVKPVNLNQNGTQHETGGSHDH